MNLNQARPHWLARTLRRCSPLVIVGWLVIAVFSNLAAVEWNWAEAIPSLERVGQQHSVALMPKNAPSAQAASRIGEVFGESDSDSSAMIVLEGQQPLGEETRHYYTDLVRELRSDSEHVEHIQDLWSDRFTASSVQSPDGKAAYAQLNLAGDQGTALGDVSVAAVRQLIANTTPPSGVGVYLTGQAPLASDMQHSGNNSILKITAVTVVIIFSVLLLVYRSLATVLILLCTVAIELATARGLVALLGHHELLVLSTFGINMLVFLTIAAGTDYGIFFIGRYHEARQRGESIETAYFTTFRGVAPVVLASGLTIAGAIFCLSFTRLPYFQTMGVSCGLGVLVAVAVAVSLVPAVMAIASNFGFLEPKRRLRERRWRGVGAAIARWPAPIFVASCALALVGLLALPGYKTSYNDRLYIPIGIPANLGFTAAERHFPQTRMMPDVLMIEFDRDMRNPSDFVVLNRLAKAIFNVRGISRVQGVTRPDGAPIDHTSIPFMLSLQATTQSQLMNYQRERVADLLTQSKDLTTLLNVMQRQYDVSLQLVDTTHRLTETSHEMEAVTSALRDHIADFDDFLRPVRNYLYWEPHCFDIPICHSFRSIFDAIDGISQIEDKLQYLLKDMDTLDALSPQMVAQLPALIESVKRIQVLLLTMHSTFAGIFNDMDESSKTTAEMGQAFDAAKNDDTFYLPIEIFKNADFQRAIQSFMSPDGRAARFIITHIGDPATSEGIARVDQVKTAAEEALKGTPLVNARIYMTGAASTAKDWKDGSRYDLLIAGIAALCLVFVIMLIITRSFIASLVIVGTVALSLGASFGLSVVIWQYILGIQLHWMVMAMTVIILLAVGSDYNLLLVSRMKEELGAGMNTGLIRAMGGTGKVVTTAGLVFAFTMAAMVVSDLRIIGQIGTTIAISLLFDTLVVRSFLTPSIAVLLGRWFWWPREVRPRPASSLLAPYASRSVTRSLLLSGERRRDEPQLPQTERHA